MDRLLSAKQVREVTSLSERQQDRLEDLGKFPKSFPLYEGGRRKARLESEVLKWMADRVAAARGNGHDTPPADPPAKRRPPLQRAQPPPRRTQRGAPKSI